MSDEQGFPDSAQRVIDSLTAAGLASNKVEAFGPAGPDLRRPRTLFHLQTRHELEVLRGLIDGPMVLFKGLEIAQLYAEAWQRDFIDVDVLCVNVDEADELLRDAGYSPLEGHPTIPGFHQTAALARADSPVTVELHRRPHWPAWSSFPLDEFFDTALSSRTGIDGLSRPRDDFHTLIVAWHFWRDGAHRLRDLIDLHQLAKLSSDDDLSALASQLGVGTMWRRTRAALDVFEGHRKRAWHDVAAFPPNGTSERRRRIHQWYGIGLGGIGGRAELADRNLRRRQRRDLGIPQ